MQFASEMLTVATIGANGVLWQKAMMLKYCSQAKIGLVFEEKSVSRVLWYAVLLKND